MMMMMMKLVLITHMKSHIVFRMVPKLVLNDPERRNGRYLALLHWQTLFTRESISGSVPMKTKNIY